ncbi:MAG TPA: PadR family transcriptional regulator [Candidatus Dormibacteraeota bacterium]|jgi:DNA-binding PadR family transcriptional regulator|nr:PadR family transcriptional regulator [Candidatus Dormibacteraeota bacterium]
MNDLLLLAMLLGGPTHGYELKKRAGWVTGQPNLHNNLVYPLLGKFRKAGWISRKTSTGQRGQTREVYSLTAKGKAELLQRLNEFSAKDAASDGAFRLRVGMFSTFDADARGKILHVRDEFLQQREKKFVNLASAMQLGQWGGEVTSFLLRQVQAERKWISRLKRLSGATAK